MKEQYELITPKLAEKYLNTNTHNRPLRPGHSEQMVLDMTNGTWTDCLAPIAFFEDGSLADGQHRLWAVVFSGVSARFLVVRDLPLSAQVNIDRGITRSIVDIARISGNDDRMNNVVSAICKGVEDGHSSQGSKYTRTTSEMLELFAKHKDAAHWAAAHGPVARGIRNAPVLSAIARAWYHEEDKDRLCHFGHALGKGFINSDTDSAAIALRNFMIGQGQKGISTVNYAHWQETFLRAQRAIWMFMRSKPLLQSRPVHEECYPLLVAAPAPRKRSRPREEAIAKRAKKRG